mmetsp:Transcript_53230/g.121693  ORF Transcript_53230/g.121693 Transcript_53230/m.121693 type:complete len:270 (-) Transcript_53230:405-1214(-)
MAQPVGNDTSSCLQSLMSTSGFAHSRYKKAKPTATNEANITAIPKISRGRLPYLSMRHTVTNVAINLTKPTPKDAKAAVLLNPASLNMLGAKYRTLGCPVTCCKVTRPQPMINGFGKLKASDHLAGVVPTLFRASCNRLCNSVSTSALDTPLRKNCSDARASSANTWDRDCTRVGCCPSCAARRANQRGERGIDNKPKNMMTDNTAPKLMIHLQLNPAPASAAPTPNPAQMPQTIMASLADTKDPRMDGGLISAMYVGAACIAKPMPSP